MRTILWIACVATSIMALTGCAGESVRPRAKTKERIGVYDSRAIAVAYAGSKAFNAWMSALMAEYSRAKAAGDQKRVAELKAEGAERQKLMHKQGFSTAPVHNILKHIKDRLPAIKQRAGVGVLVSKWDKDTLAKHPCAELVDVTMELVDAFNPNERQRNSAIAIQKHKPIPLSHAENIKDCQTEHVNNRAAVTR